MITWLTVFLLWMLYHSCRAVNRPYESISECIGATAAVVFAAVPTIYVVGWQFLPAWGVGAIPFGGR